MKTELMIPDEAVRYILFQRTAYLRFPVTFLYRHLFRRLPITTPLYNVTVALESRIFRERVKTLYQEDMRAEFSTLSEALPDSCTALLDIGSGVAGIDVLLDRHYGRQAPAIYLLDRTETADRIYYLFHQRAAFYNSLEVARDLLLRNGIAEARIHLITATGSNEITVEAQRFDLILSLLSWGFHFPVRTYVSQVAQLLSEDGRAILDVRRGTDGLEELRRWFAQVDVIIATEKFSRVVVTH